MIQALLPIIETAGKLVLAHFKNPDLKIQAKADETPITNADIESNEYLIEELYRRFPYPIISEEAHSNWAVAKTSDAFWVIDPLDGTQAYVSGSKEFSINIALVDASGPRIGIIHAPASGETWLAERGRGAHYIQGNETLPLPLKMPADCCLVKSRLHDEAEAKSFMKLNGIKECIAVSSAIKFGYVAMGKACAYVRYFQSREWDTAAGHIIVKESGGGMRMLPEKKEPTYLKPKFLNGPFFCYSKGTQAQSLLFPANA